MSHRKREEGLSAEELVPLTASETYDVCSDSNMEGWEEEAPTSLAALPPEAAAIPQMDLGECRQHIATLHEEVEKLFEMPTRFDIADLVQEPEVVSHNVESKPSEVSLSDKVFGEEDYAVHRRTSYPHIHQPLRSISSKSLKAMKSSGKSRRKKKKRKIRSFPSKQAMTSEAIPEEAEDAHLHEKSPDSEDDSEDSGESSEEGEEEEEVEAEGEGEDDVDAREVDGEQVPAQTTSSGGVEFFIGKEQLTTSQEPLPIVTEAPASPPSSPPTSPPTSFAELPISQELAPIPPQPPRLFERSVSEEPQRSHIYQSGQDELGQPVKMDHLAVPSRSFHRSFSTESQPKVRFQVGPDGSSLHLEEEEGSQLGSSTSLQSASDVSSTASTVPPRDLTVSPSEVRLGRKHKHHHQNFRKEDLLLRRQRGSEVNLDHSAPRWPTENEEASMLPRADLDDMASHRLEDVRGIRRHKINRRRRSTLHSIVHVGKTHKEKKPVSTRKVFDHSPHEMFVELDELFAGEEEWEWREKARWIKFEEDVEEGAERWGKPHVASLSFHSLLELRRGLESGSLMLDLEVKDFPSIVNAVVDNMCMKDLIREEDRGNVLRTLLLRHKHVSERTPFIRRNVSYTNLVGLEQSMHRRHQTEKVGASQLIKSLSSSSFQAALHSSSSINTLHNSHSMPSKPKTDTSPQDHGPARLEMVKVDVDNNMEKSGSPSDLQTAAGGVHVAVMPADTQKSQQAKEIMRRIPFGAEAFTVLVGSVDFLEKPAMAFVRLAQGQLMDSLTEVPLPVRFVFILLGPENSMDYHEVGRSISTLMSNQFFHDVAYRAETREELLQAINVFLDDSIVLPPGDWDQKTLLPIMDMARKRAHIRQRRKRKHDEKEALLAKEQKSHIPTDPLQRTKCLFGGLANDIRRRLPHLCSDFRDALNVTCLRAFIFIFFACVSPAIAFGGLLSEKTDGLLGVSENLISTSVCGIIFALFSGQPLMIIGATGPVLVFEQSLYKFCSSHDIEFLQWRAWIGLWVLFFSIIIVALEGSFLVRYVTRFTEEIFAILISLIFLYEVVKKVVYTFEKHPLLLEYCTYNDTDTYQMGPGNYSLAPNSSQVTLYPQYNTSTGDYGGKDFSYGDHRPKKSPPRPNTALLTVILVLGTFLIAYFLRKFRNSKFLGRSVRRTLGDFGILIAIVVMTFLDWLMEDVITQKLKLSADGMLSPTSPDRRGWFINPLGDQKPMELWMIFAAIIPGFLIFILLFMEVQITEWILIKKERGLKKGSGFHLDQLLMGLLTFLCGMLGWPWLCAATVRTVAHVSSLSIMSRTHAPGEKPRLLEVKEQRVTNMAVHLAIGLSLLLGSVLRHIPIAVLFGVFLYLGVSAISGVQMFDRLRLFFQPVKHHPSVGYVRRVRTMKMHLFTVIQLVCVIILWVVKSTAAALAFPFMLILLIPLRLQLLPRIFSHTELEELDKDEEDSDDEDMEDPDFYQQAHMPI